MKKLMKIGLASTLGLALAIPACAQNVAQSDRVISAAGTASTQGASLSTTTSVSTQGSMLIGSLGTTTTTASVAALVIVAGAEAVSSTGHTK